MCINVSAHSYTAQNNHALHDLYTPQVKLHAEKLRADDYERKYVEAHDSREELRKKLAETEKRVYQLQDSLNR